MIIIVGLGNPGEKFNTTRHNVGFEALDFFAQKNNFPEFTFSKKYNSLISEKKSETEDILLVKPQTFMNDSGMAVQKVLADHKSQLQHIIVVHDDIDLPVGKLKIIKERGSAGHKGVESIIQHIGNDNLVRFRIGIAKGEVKDQKALEIVLKKFSKEEQQSIQLILEKTALALTLFINEGLERAMNQYN